MNAMLAAQFRAAADWGEPRHFNALDENLGMEVATAGIPFNGFALRILKSDALVGIEPSIADKAAAKFNDWRSRGHFAVVQSL